VYILKTPIGRLSGRGVGTLGYIPMIWSIQQQQHFISEDQVSKQTTLWDLLNKSSMVFFFFCDRHLWLAHHKKKPKKTWGCPHNYLKRWQYTPQLHLGGWRFWIWLVDLVFSLLEKATPPSTHHPPTRGVLCPPLCIFRASGVFSPAHTRAKTWPDYETKDRAVHHPLETCYNQGWGWEVLRIGDHIPSGYQHGSMFN